MSQSAPLPKEKFLALYWLPDVGIGDPKQHVQVPLTDVLDYVLPNGKVEADLVYLFAATLTGSQTSFTPPYISIGDDLMKELTPGKDGKSNVQKLQEAGVRVVLSVLGSEDMGWSNMPSDKLNDFAAWTGSEILQKFGLDGIDIDDEGSSRPQDAQNFVNTVAAMRTAFGDKLISKALWNDSNYFPVPVSGAGPLAGSYLSSLLDFGATMSYGLDFDMQISTMDWYHTVTNSAGEKVGMPYDRLCIGVQAGPPESSWMTGIGETEKLARWSVEPQSSTKTIPPIMGMMLYTFSQDIQQWDEYPQNQPKYKWPNPDDHRWQKALVKGMWG